MWYPCTLYTFFLSSTDIECIMDLSCYGTLKLIKDSNLHWFTNLSLSLIILCPEIEYEVGAVFIFHHDECYPPSGHKCENSITFYNSKMNETKIFVYVYTM